MSVASSVLTAPLLLLGGLWALALWASLWRRHIEAEGSAAFAAARDLGLVVRPASLRGRVVAQGQLGGQDVRLIWLGGPGGLRTQVEVRDTVAVAGFVANEAALRAALAAQGLAV